MITLLKKKWDKLIHFKEWDIYEIVSRIRYKIKDYDRLEYDYCCVLDHATGSMMSKPNYERRTIYQVIDDNQKERYHDEIKTDLLKILNTNNPQIEDIRDYVNEL